MQFVCLRCCILPDFVVKINNFFSLVLFFTVIHKRRRKKLISKTIKYKLDSSPKMQFDLFYPNDIQKFFWKTVDFAENLGMTQIARDGLGRGGGAGVMFSATLWCNVYENRYVIHPLEIQRILWYSMHQAVFSQLKL